MQQTVQVTFQKQSDGGGFIIQLWTSSYLPQAHLSPCSQALQASSLGLGICCFLCLPVLTHSIPCLSSPGRYCTFHSLDQVRSSSMCFNTRVFNSDVFGCRTGKSNGCNQPSVESLGEGESVANWRVHAFLDEWPRLSSRQGLPLGNTSPLLPYFLILNKLEI